MGRSALQAFHQSTKLASRDAAACNAFEGCQISGLLYGQRLPCSRSTLVDVALLLTVLTLTVFPELLGVKNTDRLPHATCPFQTSLGARASFVEGYLGKCS